MNRRLQMMIRVNHAGEHGAVRIYDGQRAIFTRAKDKARITRLIDDMAAQEQSHLDCFDDMIIAHDVRPTVLSPLWHIAGFALGAASALMGEKAAMACTAAVETEIDAHYASQLTELETTADAPELASTIAAFRADEAAHRQTALEEGAADAPAYPVLTALIRGGCRLAIRLSERL